jgi:glycosyltransferase involved in cell wall biosynthesis
MRLLFITGSLVHGGAERHTIQLVNRLAERDHECHAAYVKNDPSQLERLHGAASVQCLHAERYLDLSAVHALSALIRRLRPAALVAANPYALMYASLALRRSRVAAPVMVTFHTTVLPNAKEWLKMLAYRPFFWRAERLVFVCEAQRRYWLRRSVFARSHQVVYNGIDLEHWQPRSPEEGATIRSVLGLAPQDYVIGMCAVLRPEKNHVQLVEAIARLRRRGIAARALLIGDGAMRGAIEARARALGVAGEVIVTGFQQDVRPLLGACDTVALCSDSVETFSLAALEAMALERPVVHSDIGGAAEMIRPGHEGYLFPAGDTPMLVEKLAALANGEERARMGAIARETVRARFAERDMIERYESLLQETALTRSQRDSLRKSATAH